MATRKTAPKSRPAKSTASAKSAPPAPPPLPPPAPPSPNWSNELDALIALVDGAARSYAEANRDSVRRAIDGQNPFGNNRQDAAGARVVVNLSCAHVPAFCKAQAAAYKNCHELARIKGWRVSRDRKMVDDALPVQSGESVYFGTAELNGCGIRFYGDICLVLRRDESSANHVILDRNSFEVLRAPERLTKPADKVRRQERLASWSGRWNTDLGHMVCIRLLKRLTPSDRRWTVGQVSTAICDDEDYIEVLMEQSFSAREVQEARLTADDVANDNWVGSHLQRARAPTPTLEALIWRQRRRNAEIALRAAKVPVNVVTTNGRTRD